MREARLLLLPAFAITLQSALVLAVLVTDAKFERLGFAGVVGVRKIGLVPVTK